MNTDTIKRFFGWVAWISSGLTLIFAALTGLVYFGWLYVWTYGSHVAVLVFSAKFLINLKDDKK